MFDKQRYHISARNRDGSESYVRVAEGGLWAYEQLKEHAGHFTNVESAIVIHILRLENPGGVYSRVEVTS